MKAKPPGKPPLLLLCKLSHPDPSSGWLVKGLLQRRCSEVPWANLVSHLWSRLPVLEAALWSPEAQEAMKLALWLA